MSKAHTSPVLAAAVLSFTLVGCASTPPADPQQAELQTLKEQMAEALKPASQEEIDAANRADPITRANFWAKEHQKDPSNVQTALTFGESLRAIGSNERVIEMVSKTLTIAPDNPDLLMLLGRAFAAEGSDSGAVQAFYKAAALNPTNSSAYASLGVSLDKLGEHDKAQAAYKQALKLSPNRTSTLTNYGLSLALSGDLAAAESMLRQASERPDADARVKENLALIVGLQGRIGEFEKISGASAPNSIVKQNAEALRQMVKPTRSWEDLEAGLDAGATAEQQKIAAIDPQPLPENAEPVKAAASKPVEAETLPLAGADVTEETSETAVDPVPSLRLRR